MTDITEAPVRPTGRTRTARREEQQRAAAPSAAVPASPRPPVRPGRLGAKYLAALGDNQLIARMQAGEVGAFTALYDRYHASAYRVASLIAADRPQAEEAVQEAFGSIWAARATYRPERASAAAWVLRIVRNRAIDGARRAAASGARTAGADGLMTYPAAGDVAAEAVDKVVAAELRQSLDRLPPAQREVIILAFYGQLSHTEIADRLDLPLGTIKARLRRGLLALRGDLLAPAA
jgi:RNA polymerase sigma-70 factor, ECF subfamily